VLDKLSFLNPNSYGVVFLGSFVFGILLSFFLIRRYKLNNPESPFGCLSSGFTTLVVSSLSVLSFPFIFLILASFLPFFTGDRQEVEILDHSTYYSTSDDDDGNETTTLMYTPIVRIVLKSGETIERELDSSSSSPKTIGDTTTIFYDESRDMLAELSLVNFLVKIIGVLFCSCMVIILWGGVQYSQGKSYQEAIEAISFVGFKMLIPLMLLGFTFGLLSFLYRVVVEGESAPDWVVALVMFFSLCMFFVTQHYFRGMFSKAEPELLEGNDEGLN